jgi:hypothetical protein
MITIYEEKGDWDLSKVVKDDHAILQECKEIIKLWLNDAHWDITNGINYNIYLGLDDNNTKLIQALQNDITQHLYKVNGVSVVDNIEIVIINKDIVFKITVITINNLEQYFEYII